MTSFVLLLGLLAQHPLASVPRSRQMLGGALEPTARIQFVANGMSYPVVLAVTGGQKPIYVEFNGSPDRTKAVQVAILPAGTYTVLAYNSTRGFPQPVEYILSGSIQTKPGDKGDEKWSSGVTVDSKRVTLGDGDMLEVVIQKPFLSYNGSKAVVRGVEGAVIGARPYWFYFADRGQFAIDAPEVYPNGIFFLADEAGWGIDKVAADLADKVMEDLKSGSKTNDHRGHCHWSYLHVRTPDGDVPAPLKLATRDELKAAFALAFRNMLEHNYYRPYPPEAVKELKQAGWLSADVPDKELLLTLGDGVKYGKLYLDRWRKMRAAEVEAAKGAAKKK